MKAIVLVALLLGITTAAKAVPITLTLSDEEQRALYQVLDTATKAGGIETAKVTLYLLNKLNAASQPVPAPHPADPEKK